MLRKAIKSLSQLWTPLILSKFQVFLGKVPGKVFKLDETLAPPALLAHSLALASQSPAILAFVTLSSI